MNSEKKIAIIIGAGPAGLTCAYELLERTKIQPIIFEQDSDVGGLAKTINYKGNRMDIGGHRFFSKSDRVMQWWFHILPLQKLSEEERRLLKISYQGKSRFLETNASGPDPKTEDRVMLVRKRVSRIFYLRKFFQYPLSLSFETIKNLGVVRLIRIAVSYFKARLFPIREEKSLEDFFINRFGRELYKTFFKDYTEKVWGVPCDKIKPEWGAQRVKGLSVSKAIVQALKKVWLREGSLEQKNTETSLIERFIYPKFGPGHLWNEVKKKVMERGGQVFLEHKITEIIFEDKKITAVKIKNIKDGKEEIAQGDYFFSTMPIKDLIFAMGEKVPEDVKRVAVGLHYRDYITVGLLLKKLGENLPDNWIYIQEKDVKIGRLQIYNNWSPYLVKDPNTAWVGLEYFCNVGDELWNMPDTDIIELGKSELEKLGITNKEDVLDATLVRVPKTYPAYFGTYEELPVIRKYLDEFENLYLLGRNGMHRYNNQDHSMLTAMTAVDNIISGRKDKTNIWEVNAEQEYHEEK